MGPVMILNPRYYSASKAIRKIVSLLPPREDRNNTFRTESSFSDIVTEYDVRLENAIRENILTDYPADGIVGEELRENGDGMYCWYINLIDGTTNFVNYNRTYAVSIACYENTHLLFGLFYDVERDELYSAYKGEGAFLNGKKLECSKNTELSRMILTVSITGDTFFGEPPLCRRFRSLSSAVRSLGCDSLEICSIASLSSDIFVGMKIGS